jgi:hypothetical protein
MTNKTSFRSNLYLYNAQSTGSCLVSAVTHGHADAVALLLNAGADVDVKNMVRMFAS